MDKAAWRARLRRARQEFDAPTRAVAEVRLNQGLLDLAVAQGAQVVAVYAPTGSEADPGPFAMAWRARGGMTAYPRVVRAGHLEFARVTAPGELEPRFRGIFEPGAGCPAVPLAAVDIIVVPLLGFDLAGHRLGQGGGYYDRLLAAPERRALAVGFAFEQQLLAAVPTDAHDVRLDAIVTESGVVMARSRPR